MYGFFTRRESTARPQSTNVAQGPLSGKALPGMDGVWSPILLIAMAAESEDYTTAPQRLRKLSRYQPMSQKKVDHLKGYCFLNIKEIIICNT